MLNLMQLSRVLLAVILLLAASSAQLQDSDGPSFAITLEDIVMPEQCSPHGWRIGYERTVTRGGYAQTPLWRYFVQRVDGDLNLVDYWGSGYGAYVQDYMLMGNPLRSGVTTGSYIVPLWSDTYEAETIEYVLDGDHVIWEIRATVRCEDGVVTEAEIVSEAADGTRESLPEPEDNLVLALDDITIYRYAGLNAEPLGTIRACQTFFLSDIRMRRASITTYGTESLTGHEIVIAGGLSPVPLVDVAEDYGQLAGQPIHDACSKRTV